MKIKTVLLSGATCVAFAACGWAGDVPARKASAPEALEACPQAGQGHVRVPGSDTCLRLSGRLRAEILFNDPLLRSDDHTRTRARGYIGLDALTLTEWGPVRASTRFYLARENGRPMGSVPLSPSAADVVLDWAYVQGAGVTAGRLPNSFFDFAPFGGISLLGGGLNGRGSDQSGINALAYTFDAGNGFAATLSLEDATERRGAIEYGVVDPAGHAMPDLVGRLDYTAGWGQAALTAAIHQTRVLPGANNLMANPAVTKPGFAVQGGLKVNLPMLAPGDALFLQAAYADGASSYAGWGPASGIGAISGPNFARASKVAAYSSLMPDLYSTPDGTAHTAKSWSVTGGLEHVWTPVLASGVFASIGGHCIRPDVELDFRAVSIGTNLQWRPVKGLSVTGEIVYETFARTPQLLKTEFAEAQARGDFASTASSAWFGRLRMQRDF